MRPHSKEPGFTLLQLIVTLAVISVVSTLAALGITTARASMRLSNSTRQFGAYVERARADAVRRHGSASVQMLTTSSYSVTMDFGAGGTVTTQTFPLETNVTFITTLQTISFDWRGRIPNEISVGFRNESGTANVNITGSGDVTIDSEIFHDTSVPGATYNSNVSGDVVPDPTATPTPTPDPDATPTPTPTATPTPTPTPEPDPTPPGQGHKDPTPTPTPTPIPTPTPTPTATPAPDSSPMPCLLLATPRPLIVVANGSGVIAITKTSLSGSVTVTTQPDNNGQIQVSPTSAVLTGVAVGTFTITVKKQSGSVTFSSSGCDPVTVAIDVLDN